MNKKVLILTYYWPPAGGPGVQRVLKFVKHLRKTGWEPIVLTVANGDYPAMDYSLEKEIPENLKVYKTKTLEPFSLFKTLSNKKNIDTYVLNNRSEGKLGHFAKYVRANFFIPDARIGWKFFALRAAKRIIQKEKPELIFSTSPPHSVQIIAKKLAKKHSLKWVADFRDPWVESYTNQHLPRTKWAKKRDMNLEQKVVKKANFVTLASDDFKPLFQLQLSNVQEITNSFETQKVEEAKVPTPLSLAYAGSMSESQVPIKLLQTLANTNFRINYYGNVAAPFYAETEKQNLTAHFTAHGYVEKSKLIAHLQENTILLLLMQPYALGSDNIPLKLFDYLAANRFILAFGNKNGRTAHILEETQAGMVFSYDEPFGEKELKEILKRQQQFSPNKEKLEQFTSEATTQQLAQIFNKITH